ncbi:MAG TPA: inorganic pyrophosphatase [Thermoanaerobaculia bacterium]|nr:inorganic pyrophosphatase [Thermoanaerobaculia bacterium]
MSFRTFQRWRPHPWHGLAVGPEPPRVVNAYVEITPFDSIKYEVDKDTGYLVVDRPQRSSSSPPALYGFVPRTYCGERVGALMAGASVGDDDPLDICVIGDRVVSRSEVIVRARVVGGLPMLDAGQADDKIVAVMAGDHVYDQVEDVSQLPPVLVERLRHYFLTYKLVPGAESPVTIAPSYGREHAERVVEAAILDYDETYGAAD